MKFRFTLVGLFLVQVLFAQKANVADSFLLFVKANKAKSSVYITNNDTVIARLNEDKIMPLASTVKIMVAIEFAKQASAGVINEDSYVALKDLDAYYLKNTDGDAHPSWLEYEKGNKHIKEDSIKLIDVARGMIMYSSNANTEYLCDLLGFDNVKNNIQLLGLKKHSAIYPLVSSLFMYQNPRAVNEDKILKAISKMNEEQYSKNIFRIHNQLKYDSTFKLKFRPQDLSLKMQKLWSDKLPASTTKEYNQIAKILNNRKFFNDDAYAIIADVLEFPMESKAFQNVFKHYGVKGGSTGFVLTHVIYLTKKDGTKMELCIFLNNLTIEEQQKLEQWLDPFEAQVIFNKKFREKLVF
jgi:D-alanyl-D-alanine carboxypeptidase